MFLVLPKVSQVMQDVTLEKVRFKKKKLAEEHTELSVPCVPLFCKSEIIPQ